MLGLRSYNYAHFTGDLLRELVQSPFSGPQPGDYAPDFRATTTDGTSVRLSDYRGRKNVLLVFGSVTCPMTAASIGGINELYDEFGGEDVEFLFVYVREAHPGERIGAHGSDHDKVAAANLIREEEDLQMPVVVDDLRGSIHRKYSGLPNGMVPYATTEDDFHAALDRDGGAAVRGLDDEPSLLRRPGRVLSITALVAAVLAGGLYAGFELRKRRLGMSRNPYRAYEKEDVRDTETDTDYGAVGI